jgi:TatA/E family protein of Tat protein translocase
VERVKPPYPHQRDMRKGVSPEMPNIGSTEIIIVVAVIVILFGVNKLPALINAITNAIRKSRSASKEK